MDRIRAQSAGQRTPPVGARPAAEGDAEFAARVEHLRGELHAHCYRMLGSVYDADDALQDTLLRAWRGMQGFAGRSSLRTWLYTIATNVCLTQISRRSKRVLPIDYGPAADAHEAPGRPVVEDVWIEPYPDELGSLGEGRAAPDARYEQREAIELAFVAALQHLAPNQRAVLILREVLGFSAREAAEMLDTTVASVNSALQRARAAVDERVPDQTQQATLRRLGDTKLQELVARYMEAWERTDIAGFTALLVEDATFAMPPLATWYRGRETIRTWAAAHSLSGAWRWRPVPVSANGQPALAFYAWDEGEAVYTPFALNVLTLRGELVADVTAFIVRATTASEPEAYVRFPEQPMDGRRLAGAFERFGLPARLA